MFVDSIRCFELVCKLRPLVFLVCINLLAFLSRSDPTLNFQVSFHWSAMLAKFFEKKHCKPDWKLRRIMWLTTNMLCLSYMVKIFYQLNSSCEHISINIDIYFRRFNIREIFFELKVLNMLCIGIYIFVR